HLVAQLTDDVAQEAGDRSERKPATVDRDTEAGGDEHVINLGLHAANELSDEARLAHAGVATDENGPRLAGDSRREGRGEEVELLTAADEVRTGHAVAPHSSSVPPGHWSGTLLHGCDVIGDQPVRLAVHRFGRCSIGSVDQAEDL